MRISQQLTILAVLSASFGLVACAGAGEHAGEKHEHAGEKHEKKEHAGEEHEEHAGEEHEHKEHAGKKHGKKKHFSPKEVESAIKGYIHGDQELKNGFFFIHDPELEHDWKLKFAKLHPVRVIEKNGEKTYFACSNFKAVGDEDHETLDLDFWMRPDEHGELTVRKIRIHKVDGEARFTYKNDKPVKK